MWYCGNGVNWEMVIPGKIIVRFVSTVTEAEIDSLNAEYGLTIYKIVFEGMYILLLPSGVDLIEILMGYYKSDIVKYSWRRVVDPSLQTSQP